MTKIVWDQPGERVYESGVDRGVLHFPEGGGVAWNGLTSVDEKTSTATTPVYFDGQKINDIVTVGDSSATLKAYTYPDEFLRFEGILEDDSGFFLTNQPQKRFHLSYRTLVGNDLTDGAGYKIHIWYNLTATPSSKSYDTLTLSADLIEFTWDLDAIPEEVDGYRPTAHIVLDSRKMDVWLLQDIEALLHGTDSGEPSLPPLKALMSYIRNWDRLIIVDNGDGTWRAEAARDTYITMLDATTFQIDDANAVYLDADTYEISSTENNEEDIWLP